MIASGPLEGTNNKIKTMKRQAYGFRDRESFKLKILAIHESKYELVGSTDLRGTSDSARYFRMNPLFEAVHAVQSWYERVRRAPARRPGPLPRDHPRPSGYDPGVPAADRATGAPGRVATPAPVRPPQRTARSGPAPLVRRRGPGRRLRGDHRRTFDVGIRETEAEVAAAGAATIARRSTPGSGSTTSCPRRSCPTRTADTCGPRLVFPLGR
jgi:hypothetical protein